MVNDNRKEYVIYYSLIIHNFKFELKLKYQKSCLTILDLKSLIQTLKNPNREIEMVDNMKGRNKERCMSQNCINF
jgi:hypothetical protein